MTSTGLAVATTVEERPQLRVLILDDSEIDRQRVLRLCRQAGLGMQATEAGTIAEFCKALDLHRYDLIFVDYLLVAETGLDAVDLLTRHPDQQAAAAIMIAGEGQIDIAVESMRRGCADYLTKSMLTVAALQKSVATAFERKMMLSAIGHEQSMRAALEQSVRRYANGCTADMRTVLSAALRRIRVLRGFDGGQDGYAKVLGTLEQDFNQLWTTMTAFRRDMLRVVDEAPARPRVLGGADEGPAALPAVADGRGG